MSRNYLIRAGDSISQLLNVIVLNGEPDESISGRSYRMGIIENHRSWLLLMKLINLLFLPFEKEHCKLAYCSDLFRARVLIKQHNDLANPDKHC